MKAKLGRKILIGMGILVVLAFAIEGGEWGTFDLLSQRGRKARLQAEVDSLERAVDSLAKYKRRLETDPVLQERIAREVHGMVRGEKEILYWLVEPREGSASPP